jgi:MFS family permease
MAQPNSPRTLWRHRDFMHLWSAETVSQLGSQVSLIALPLVAITVLDATTFQVGLLTAVEFSPFVLFGLPAGAIVDRLSRRAVLMWSDIGRAVALGSVPLAYALDALTYGQLLFVVFVTGTLTVFFDVAYQAILPALVPREQIAEGNAKLEISRSGATLAGPGLGGVLVQWLGAANAVLADGISFVMSAGFIRAIRAREAEPEPETVEQRALLREIKEGLHYVLHHRVLRLIAGATGTANYFGSIVQAVVLVYAVRQLDYTAGVIGLVFSIANLGVLIAALGAARITSAVKLGRSIWLGMTSSCIGLSCIPLAPPSNALPLLIVGYLVFGFGGTLYNIGQVSLRQAITPDRLQGRMNASMRFMVWGTMPFGFLTGGILGSAIGLRPTLFVGAIGGLLAIPWLTTRPILELQEIPEPIDE